MVGHFVTDPEMSFTKFMHINQLGYCPNEELESMGLEWSLGISILNKLPGDMHWRKKWQPTPVFLPGESRDGGAWWAAVYGFATSRTRLK